MLLFSLVCYLLAGVCFGAAAGNVATRTLGPVNFLGLGLVLYVLVEVVQAFVKLG